MPTNQEKDRIDRPSPLACIECRKKHLKCDAATPICSRCISRGLECSYTPSRRGIAGRTRRPQSTRNTTSTLFPSRNPNFDTPSTPTDLLHEPTRNVERFLQAPLRTEAWQDRPPQDRLNSHSPVASTISTSSLKSSLRSEDDHLTNLYYSHFHQSHPFLVPRYRFSAQDYPDYLQTAIRFVGSHYSSNLSSDNFRASVESIATGLNDKTPEAVQAYLLCAIALHARYEPVEAMHQLTRAAELAISLGMHNSDFAISHANGDTTYEESLRRTWWELYVTDGYLASLHRHTNFKSNTVFMTTSLPCEESAYNNGSIPSDSLSLCQFDDRLFSDDELHFSSFSYRIDAIRIMARVMAVSKTNETHADAVQAIDNAIASWKVHLSNDKASILDYAGEADQMMFQANAFIHCASIFLHFPRSELPITMPSAAEIACAQQHMEQVSPTSTQHAVKAINASKDLANLAALPVEKHSPFFICALVFAAIVQLSACTAYSKGSTEQNRDRIALIIGLLKAFSRNWAIAHFVGQQLKKAANQIFNSRSTEGVATASSREGTSSATDDSGIDVTSFPMDVSWLDLFSIDGLPIAGIADPNVPGLDQQMSE